MKKLMLVLFVGILSFVLYLQSNVSINQKEEVKLLSVPQTLQYGFNKRRVPRKWNGEPQKIVYLTFDDGPSKNTEAILNILSKYNIKATFFHIGMNVIRRPELVKEVNDRGHYIGLHTMSHDQTIIYDESKPDALSNELLDLQENIYKIINKKPTLLRPPYGSKPGIKTSIAESLVKNQFKVWDWTVDSMDWRSKSVSEIMNRIQSQTSKPLEVVLMHEKDITVLALPTIIEYYMANGYEFRTYNPQQHITVNFLHDDRL